MQERKASFLADLRELTILTVVRKHITLGHCFILNDDLYFDLKARTAEHFRIHPSEVLVVGSGKLGFSIAPQKRYRPFGDASDIDVAIVSHYLFDEIWAAVRRYKREGGYWPDLEHFRKYLFEGWIRPDKLPRSKTFRQTRDWWDFFRSLTTSERYGPYKITGALYRSWDHIEAYQAICVGECQRDLESAK